MGCDLRATYNQLSLTAVRYKATDLAMDHLLSDSCLEGLEIGGISKGVRLSVFIHHG